MKDLGEARFLLGIEIRRRKNWDVFLVQEKYARDMLSRFNMEGCKSMSTPLELGSHLDSTQQPTSNIEVEQMVNILGCGGIQTLIMRGIEKHPEVFQATSFSVPVQQSPGDHR